MSENSINFTEASQIADRVVFEQTGKHLTDLEITIFRGAWHNQTYEEMAVNTDYTASYLHRIVGQKLWERLSTALGEKVGKKNFKTALERKLCQNKQAANDAAKIDSAEETYVERPPLESRCYETLLQPGSLIRIKAPAGMGKTLLSLRMLEGVAPQNYRTVYLNLNLAAETECSNLDKFLQWFCVIVGKKMRIKNQLADYWDDRYSSSTVNCTEYFEQYLLPSEDSPLVLCLDEVERIFPYHQVAEGFLGLLRAWHEDAKINETWKQLRLMVVHATEVYIPLNINQSPFNVGVPVELPEFKPQQIRDLARCYGLELNLNQVNQLMKMVGGHPHLVQQALSQLRIYQQLTLDQLLADAPTEAGIYSHHLRENLLSLQKHPDLLEALKQVVFAAKPVRLDSTIAYKLQSMGLVQMQGNDCTPRCDLYAKYFRDRLGN
ncbi:AAA-like domain-containing protein [Planktothricoides raciborskii]|uniref:AAA-like domain-containing protein n=1 Tax=Planktothricoides raciborskii FACHB-1370 TaxID=2949576 RepID=A0ABR8EH47_9CYAN|nr:AAA-like domain-containing protein [Planktothricoides raciborskii]MBD2545414.1 AAA-like domain-containing protein [Planktothricoides raciborskii FACHB-1370]MBD2583161.1 AAA-like domain-containing protein [Planktothricoides raciborskii FACHB-1261]